MGGKGSGRKAVISNPDDASSIASHIMEFMSWKKPDRKNVQELYASFGRYVQYCIDNGVQMTNLNAYMSMGLTKDDVYDWEHLRWGTPEHQKFIRDVKMVLASYREQAMIDGKISPVVGIWHQKNYEGYRDIQETVVALNKQNEQYSIEDIQKRYSLPENDVGGTPEKK